MVADGYIWWDSWLHRWVLQCLPNVCHNSTQDWCCSRDRQPNPQQFHMSQCVVQKRGVWGFCLQCIWHKSCQCTDYTGWGRRRSSKARVCVVLWSSHVVPGIVVGASLPRCRLAVSCTCRIKSPCIHGRWGLSPLYCSGQWCHPEKAWGAFACTHINQVECQDTCFWCLPQQICFLGYWWHCSTLFLQRPCQLYMWWVRTDNWCGCCQQWFKLDLVHPSGGGGQ